MGQKSRKPSLTVAAMIAATLFAKALGLFRSMLMAWTMGDTQEAVAFAAASKIPSLFFDIIFSAAILGAFIPHYSAAANEERGAREFASSFLGAMLAAASLFSLIGIIFAPQITAVFSPGLSAESAALAARLLRIMFPAVVFTAGAYTLTGLLQAHGNFILPAGISAVSNIFIICFLLFGGKAISPFALAAAHICSWLLQLLTLALPLAAKKRLPMPKIDLKNEHLRRSLAAVPKIAAGSWFYPASALFAAFFASFISDKAFLLYDYAAGIYTIISGIAIYGVANYCLPALSKIHALGDMRGFAKEVNQALFSAVRLILPVCAAALLFSREGLSLLYAHGKFPESAANECARALSLLCAAMPASAVSEILCRAFCAAKKTWAPMYAAASAVCANLAANSLALFAESGICGIAASFAAAQWVQALFLFFAARKNFAGVSLAKTLVITPGGALCFALMAVFKQNFPLFSQLNNSFATFLKISIVFTLGIVIYLLYVYTAGLLRPDFAKKETR